MDQTTDRNEIESDSNVEFKTDSKVESKDPLYKKKLEYSYLQCLHELCEPVGPNGAGWNDTILETKFVMDCVTRYPKTNYTFLIDYPDDIQINSDDVKHSYVFKRSHFYVSFSKKKSRLKRDLIDCWKTRGYFVKLHQGNDEKWYLYVSWKN